MNMPKLIEAMNELDDELILAAAADPQTKAKAPLFRRPLPAACACLLVLVLALAAGLAWQGQRGAAPFVLTAYAAQDAGGPLASQLRPGQAVPVSAFTAENGLKGAVFSHAAQDPKAPASVLILADGADAEGTIRAIAGLELERGTVYLFCVLPEDGKAGHSFPYLLRNEAQNTVTALSISIERDGDGYSAKIENVVTTEQRAAS